MSGIRLIRRARLLAAAVVLLVVLPLTVAAQESEMAIQSTTGGLPLPVLGEAVVPATTTAAVPAPTSRLAPVPTAATVPVTTTSPTSTTRAPVVVATVAPVTSTTVSAAVPATTTTTTVAACRNSTDPACGPFRFHTQPAADRPMTVAVATEPASPVAGQEMAFRITLTDPDGASYGSSLYFLGDSGLGENVQDVCGKFGAWDPPAPDPARAVLVLTVRHTYVQSGTYPTSFAFDAGPFGCTDDVTGRGDRPYASSAAATHTVVVTR